MSLLSDNGYRPLPANHIDHDDLAALEADLIQAVKSKELFEEKLRSFFRSAIDEVIDTARTGRFFLDDLEKTEKTYLGTKFENLLRDWLQVPRGIVLDLLIEGREVDVKSTTKGKSDWMIPREAIDRFCIVLRVNEVLSKCAVGLVRARPGYLRVGKNQDKKTSFSAEGRKNIWWLVSDFSYTPNFWLHVNAQDRDDIMQAGGGSKKVAFLFEHYQEVAISRVQIIAVAAQDDPMRRIRRGGGARDFLAPKGIAVLYSENDRELMQALGLKFGYREFMSYRPKDDAEAQMLRSANHID
ncbi:NaeI family type II restriction endonuclease [Sphingopyxis sp.]|uniref:NaeI family type II restriction endonuclease n=1 Tax=Sphingopyxis sp. TaxID=1908224 RepID=UPI003D6D20B8